MKRKRRRNMLERKKERIERRKGLKEEKGDSGTEMKIDAGRREERVLLEGANIGNIRRNNVKRRRYHEERRKWEIRQRKKEKSREGKVRKKRKGETQR